MNILVTGGAGYIGSHTVRALAASKDFTPIVYDNLSTGHEASVPDDVQLITGDIHWQNMKSTASFILLLLRWWANP